MEPPLDGYATTTHTIQALRIERAQVKLQRPFSTALKQALRQLF